MKFYNFLTQISPCTCKISRDRRNRILKHMLQSFIIYSVLRRSVRNGLAVPIYAT